MNENSYYYARATEDIKFAMICSLNKQYATPFSSKDSVSFNLAGIATANIDKDQCGFFALTEEAFRVAMESKRIEEAKK